jgi:hypothetical protein
MNSRRQFWIITGVALAVFVALRSLPDTHCALLHSDHQPVLANGVEFCGINEEANYYRPKDLGFPFELKMEMPSVMTGKGGKLWILGADHHPVLDHEVALSHTQKIHLHLRQITGGENYVHLHPQPQDDGSWAFDLPEAFQRKNSGGSFLAYVDFVSALSNRSVLAEAEGTMPMKTFSTIIPNPEVKILESTLSSTRTGEVALIRLKLGRENQQPLKLLPIMGTLGHAVVFSRLTDEAHRGYAHMHPSLEGGEYDATPTLSFRLRLPPVGDYTLWLHVNQGSDQYLRFDFTVKP